MRATVVRFGEDLRRGYIGRLEWGNGAILSYFSKVSEEAAFRTGFISMIIDEVEAPFFDVVDGTLTYDVPVGEKGEER